MFLKFFQSSAINTIQLLGPFLPECEALKETKKYHDLLERTRFHSNLIVSRDLLITSPDTRFEMRDDMRIEVGITHHQHHIELFVDDPTNPEPLTIDHYIILNHADSDRLRTYFRTQPLSSDELKRITKPVH